MAVLHELENEAVVKGCGGWNVAPDLDYYRGMIGSLRTVLENAVLWRADSVPCSLDWIRADREVRCLRREIESAHRAVEQMQEWLRLASYKDNRRYLGGGLGRIADMACQTTPVRKVVI